MGIRRRGALGVAALALLAAATMACGSDDGAGGAAGGTGDGEGGCTEERVGGSLTMGTFTEAKGLDPIVQFGSGVAGGIETAAIFDRLMEWDPETGEVRPRVAESLEPNDDFTEWTLTLRPDITFGNGDPLTAEAVKFSIERTQSEQNQTQSREAAAIIESVEVVDDLTARFTLTEAWPGFPALLADEPGMVVNPAVVESMSPEEFNRNPRGAGVGPYEPVRFQPGEEIVLEARDDYWGGPVCIQELRFVWIAGGEATLDAFERGELQMAFLRDPLVVQRALDSGVQHFQSLQNLSEVLWFNTEAPHPTEDVRIRRAIAAAIDVEALDQRINEGTGAPTSAVIGEDSLLYAGAEGPAHDPEEAERLLDEVRDETGYDGSLTFLCDTNREEQAVAVEAQLESVGFDVDLNSALQVSDLIQRTRVNRDFDIACGGASVNDASPWLRLAPKIGSGNQAEPAYESEDMDAALDDLRLAETLEEQQEALVEVQEIWNRDVPSMNLATVVETIVWDESVHGLTFTSKTVVFFDQAWIEG
ncbi:MAG TPA: ABC transporter substrate-binding protein [Acidimicrobiales bacterium]